MSAAAFWNFRKYAFLMRCNSCVLCQILNIPTKFGDDWFNSNEMVTEFQNSRRRRPPSWIWVNMHSSLLPGLCKTIPLLDLFYKRMLKFVYRCLNTQSLIVNFIVRHSILFSRMNSTIGRNVLSCSQRYHTSIHTLSLHDALPILFIDALIVSHWLQILLCDSVSCLVVWTLQ